MSVKKLWSDAILKLREEIGSVRADITFCAKASVRGEIAQLKGKASDAA